jgi:preprotein translocase subunit YajC
MGQGGAAGGQGQYSGFIMILIMFAIFYFLLIRPQQKKQKEHREMVNNLKKDDRVVTSGGIYGKITGVDDQAVTVEITDKVRVKVARGNISVVLQDKSKS